ncbi:putative mitochondrial protein AtMg00240 [Nicotiana tabacum]|uniref:Mitochondrial protein AtMg00240 n=1 Tax=Nicotiana tabacum TaxID=4097 RepID=A0AC58U5V1_TOBAC
MTRPDISFSVQTLSQFLQNPKKSHIEDALRIVRYLKKQPGQGILLSSDISNTVMGFCDADWFPAHIQENLLQIKLHVDIYSDSKAAMQIAANPMYHERTKYIEIDCHFIQEKNTTKADHN